MPFEVMPQHLSSLDSKESVDVIRDLVWADASVSGISENLINIPSAINVRDGGIDGEVTGVKSDSKHGIIKSGITCYQVKSGIFSPSMKSSHIDEILLDKDMLKNRIKSCLEKDGTLVIAFTKWDNPDSVDDDIKSKFQTRLKAIDPKYGTAKIEIWRQNTIMGFLQNFPSLRLKILKMQNNDSLFFHDAWAKLDDMKPIMRLGDVHNDYLKRFRKILRSNDRPIHIRVTGDPGMGKTRLVLEALKPIDLAPLTIYVRNPGHLLTGSFLHGIANGDTAQSVILVVDECDYSESADIWNMIRDKSPNIKLVTIFNEPRKVGGDTIMLNPPNLHDKQIDSILDHDYGIPHNQRSKWVDFCQPFPRAAHVIGQNLQKNPDDILRNPDTVNVWDRFIADANSLNSPEFEQRKTILLWLSLFKRFGFEPPFDQEAKFISDKISANHSIPHGKFVDTINTLKNMHILQGHTTLYITPKILHIKLWTEWWDRYGSSMMFNLADIPVANPDTGMHTSEPQNLRGWYCEMFRYARESSVAQDVVKKLLGPGGLLENDDLLSTELGANFILTLASADPKTTLSFLGRTIGAKNKNDLMKFEQGRRQTVQTLWKTSMQKGLFTDSAHLLLALGEAENEPFSNNASGIFTSLFSPAQGPLAPTEMPPSQRLPVIRDAICSNSKERRLLAIHACNTALQTEPSIGILPLDDSLRQEADLWKPKSRQEITDYYKAVLDILQNSLDVLQLDEKQLAVSAILDNVKGLLSVLDLADYVIKTLQSLHDVHHVDNEPIIEQIEHLLAFDTLYVSSDTASKLKTLQNHLTGSDYHSRLLRYAGMHPKVDWFSESQKNREEYAHKAEIESLARQSLDAKRLLPELTWLVTDKAKNGHRFGRALGLFDDTLALLPYLLEAQRNAGDGSNEMFLAGYLRALFERDVDEWESQLDLMANDSVLYKIVIETTRMSGITDRAGKRITALLHKYDDLGYADLASLQYGMATHELSEPVFVEWVDLLLDDASAATVGTGGSMATITSLHLFYAYFMHGPERTLPKNLTLRLLFHDDISRKPPPATNLPTLEYFWTEICMRFVKQYPEERIPVVEQIFERFGNDDMIFGRYNAPTQQVLDDAAKMMPRDALHAALFYVRVPMDSRVLCVMRWIKKIMSESEISTAAILDVLFEWIDEDPEVRAALCARMIPVTLGDFEVARQILIKYGTIDNVQKTLGSGFNSESYSGSASEHYEKKKAEFELLKSQESHRVVRQWIDSHISQLDFMIRGFGMLEERDEI